MENSTVSLDDLIHKTIEAVAGQPYCNLSDTTLLTADLGLSSVQIALLLSELGDAYHARVFESRQFLGGRIQSVGDVKMALLSTNQGAEA